MLDTREEVELGIQLKELEGRASAEANLLGSAVEDVALVLGQLAHGWLRRAGAGWDGVVWWFRGRSGESSVDTTRWFHVDVIAGTFRIRTHSAPSLTQQHQRCFPDSS